MGRTKKFHFSKITFNGMSEKKGDPIAWITAAGQMYFNKEANHKYGLDGSFVDIYYDPEKRALGFRKISGYIPAEKDWTKTNRLLKADSRGVIRVSIGRIMKAVGIEKENYKSLMVESYNDLMERQTIYYVEIPRPKKKKDEEK